MPREEVYDLRPYGWENDPEVERFRLSTLDYLTVLSYNHYAIFFRLDDSAKPRAVEVLKTGLERTLAQTRHLNGRIEKDPWGGYSFTKKKDDTVRFVVQWLDDPEDADKYPSFDDIERAHYTTLALGDLGLWAVEPMTYGEKPEVELEQSPITSAFKANFVRGGLVFSLHSHHYAADVMGWAGFVHQLAENCYAFANGTYYPVWDPACSDLSRLLKEEPPEEEKVEGPPAPDKHPDHMDASSYLFHLPKSKAARLKELAKPEDGTWVSTYDAFTAFVWRHVTRLRAPIFKPAPDSKLIWSEAIDMRPRMHSPKPPARIQQNVMFVALSTTASVQQPTVSELISEWPFWKVARYVRQMTDSVTQENLDEALKMVAKIRVKSSLSTRVDSRPPMSIGQSDHRSADIVSADFGFAKPATYRYLMSHVSNNGVLVYPSRDPSTESDEGPEIVVMYEKDLAQTLIDDPIWKEFFEYRGIYA
ncbi:Acyl transferase [Colletotrichum higginsianum IMI 349063]|uniref:Acyl transferase n=2 Tax=Colletotrichum higginsianum TaxID=80884 RepID=A0A1B7Y231_COLHI|nr:Acyl transferase [Colletotrichum higginsianum IMI 349063]OBR06059.1 Acyl transferase [Colletotrichum higginsianum IMI 349063]TIC97737.1 Trichothecene 3-O-acetyltransferase [Colletotrichum higginsianum]